MSPPGSGNLTQHHHRSETTPPFLSPHRGLDAASWAQIHQKLRDFSRSTQAELERERAQLLVRATVAEEQLSELQEYVDQHLGRWALEREHGVTPGPWSGRNGG